MRCVTSPLNMMFDSLFLNLCDYSFVAAKPRSSAAVHNVHVVHVVQRELLTCDHRIAMRDFYGFAHAGIGSVRWRASVVLF